MKTLLSILFLFFATYGYSQSEKLFTVDRELSNSNINQIYQAKDGVIWIATEDGLNRYDGAKFSVYKHKEGNDSSLVDNNVRILFEDSKGNFLIGTQRGLQLYDPATDLFKEIPILYETGINMSAHISTILERKNGELLIGTSGHAVYSLTLGGTEPLIKEAQLPVPSFSSPICSKTKTKIYGFLQKERGYTALTHQVKYITISSEKRTPGI